MTEFYMFMFLQDIAPENSWLGGVLLMDCKHIWKTKLREMKKIDRDDGNKTQTLYRCHFNFTLPKLIVDNGLEDLWRRENSDNTEFTRYNRSSGTRSRIGKAYTDIKIANSIKSNHKMISVTDHYEAITTDESPPKKIPEKIYATSTAFF